MMYVAIGEKNRDTIHVISSLQACFIIAHSSEGILFLRIYIYIYTVNTVFKSFIE